MLENRRRNVILTGKRFIQLEFGNRRSDHVKDITLNLSAWIRESIESLVGGRLDDAILDRNGHVDKDIVLGFRLANDVELLDTETQLKIKIIKARRASSL